MNAMVFAAGRGSRLQPLTDSTPKALLEVDGVSLLERQLLALQCAGYRRVVINLGWHGEQIVAAIGGGSRFGLDVVYSPEGEHILETGGGAFRALPLLGDDPFLAVNADILTDMPLPAPELAANDLGKLLLVPQPTEKASGDFSLRGDRIGNDEPRHWTFGGIAIYRAAFFAGCEDGRFSIVPLMRAAADAGRLGGFCYAGPWADIGTPERFADVRQNWRRPLPGRLAD